MTLLCCLEKLVKCSMFKILSKCWLLTSHISISKNFSYLIDWFFWITSARVERETGSGQQDLFVAAPLTEHVCFRDELQKNLFASDDSCKQRSAKRKADETRRCSRYRTRTYIRVRRECMHCSSKSGRQTFEGSKIGFWGSRENELRLHLLLKLLLLLLCDGKTFKNRVAKPRVT